MSTKELAEPLYRAKGWMQFIGIINIISGVLTALSVVGILVAWLPIWLGVILFQAGSAAGIAYEGDDKAAFMRATGKLKTYFVVTGVVIIISFVLGAIAFLFFGAAIMAAIASGAY